jgi:putative addiction module component (TIGR02574 family)
MPTTFASLGLGELSADEKLDLIGQLWNDLFASVPPGSLLTEAQRQELQRRVDDAAARPDDWVSWEDVEAGIDRRLGE